MTETRPRAWDGPGRAVLSFARGENNEPSRWKSQGRAIYFRHEEGFMKLQVVLMVVALACLTAVLFLMLGTYLALDSIKCF